MKIKHKDSLGREQENGIEGFAARCLDGDDYGKGRVESAAATAENNSRAIGRLLDLLAEGGVVSADEVAKAVGSSGSEFSLSEA